MYRRNFTALIAALRRADASGGGWPLQSSPPPTSSLFLLRRFASSATTTTTLDSSSSSQNEQFPVVIAGGGPTGLTTALLLSHYGVPCVVLERAEKLTTHPQAHFINHRTMEVFRGLDGLAHEVVSRMPPLSEWRSFLYCTAMAGNDESSVLGRVDHFQGQTSPAAPHVSPEPVAHLSQHKLLPLLAKRVQNAANIDYRMGQAVTSVEERSNSVKVEIESTSSQSRYTIDAQYVVAAEGAHSNIRQQLNIPMKGPGPIQHLINIHFRSKSLGESLVATNRCGMLYFVFNSGVIAVMVAHSLQDGEFVAQIPYFPPLQQASDFTLPAVAAEMIRRAAGDSSLPVEILGVRPWAMSAAVAAEYSSRQGRVLLAGDAAHVVPPSGALGMNTGVQDAHNLAWKLAMAVLHNNAIDTTRLLKSYGAERRPVAESNMRLSVANFHEALRVAQIMGLDFKTANAFNDLLSSGPLSWAPAAVRRTILDAAIVAGRTASGAIAALRRKELDDLFNRGETLRLQYPKEDLGFLYSPSSAAAAVAVAAPHSPIECAISYNYEDPNNIDAKLSEEYIGPKPRDAPYQPTTLPGARLPHFWVRVLRHGNLNFSAADLIADKASIVDDAQTPELVSSVDLMPAAGLKFVLLLSSCSSSSANTNSAVLQEWVEATKELSGDSTGGVMLCPVVVIGASHDAQSVQQLLRNDDDTVAIVQDVDIRWGAFRGISSDSAVLVRPDGHVAWRGRCTTNGTTGKVELLQKAIHRIVFGDQ